MSTFERNRSKKFFDSLTEGLTEAIAANISEDEGRTDASEA